LNSNAKIEEMEKLNKELTEKNKKLKEEKSMNK